MLMKMVKIAHENVEEVKSWIADGTQGPPNQCQSFAYNSPVGLSHPVEHNLMRLL